jgi:predicted transcriptional regulator
MISFACKQIQLKDIITCSFELSKTEYNLFLFLLQEPEPLTIQAIAEKQSLERSTVQKAISKLHAKNLLKRRQLNVQNGGYRYLYSILDKEECRKRLIQIVDGWHAQVLDAVKKW